MKVNEIMTTDVEVIQPNDTLQTAALKMRKRDIGLLPVMDGHQLVGMLSDRDIILRATAEGMDPKAALGRDLMTSPVVSCYQDQDVKDAAEIMEKHQVRRLAVLDRKNEALVGVLSLSDLAVTGNYKLSGEILQHVSEPTGVR
ncbi:MAG TPA: CBS domain-containing protein [Anaerolineales bacterium]|jgi:CBS domain-containing protein|nr:CBS domain-containing protein [Anaerolineales bacterium]